VVEPLQNYSRLPQGFCRSLKYLQNGYLRINEGR